MGSCIRIGNNCSFLYLFIAAFIPAAFAQGSFTGQCQTTSTPVQARSEGITERIGDIVLFCSNGTRGAAFAGNLTVLLPVSITNRIDDSNQTRDAGVSLDLGSGFVPGAAAGQVSGNSISFHGIATTVPASGSFGLRISGIRANI